MAEFQITLGSQNQNVRGETKTTVTNDTGSSADVTSPKVFPAGGVGAEGGIVIGDKKDAITFPVSGLFNFDTGSGASLWQAGATGGLRYKFFATEATSWSATLKLGGAYTSISIDKGTGVSGMGALVLFEISGQLTDQWSIVASRGMYIPSFTGFDMRQGIDTLGVRRSF